MQYGTEQRPSVVLLLSMIGIICQLFGAIFVAVTADNLLGTSFINNSSVFFVTVWALLAGLIITASFLGIALLENSRIRNVRIGAVLLLLVSLLAIPTDWGVAVGSLLMFAGGLFALTWKPQRFSYSAQVHKTIQAKKLELG